MRRHLLEAQPSQPPNPPTPDSNDTQGQTENKNDNISNTTVTPSKNGSSTANHTSVQGTTAVNQTVNRNNTAVSTVNNSKASNSTLLVAPVNNKSSSDNSTQKSRAAVIATGGSQPSQDKNWTEQAKQAIESLGHIHGIPITILIAVGVVVLIIVIICICIAYKRYRSRKDYNQNPELFAHKPELSGGEQDNLEQTEFKPFLSPDGVEVIPDQQVKGKLYRVQFNDPKPSGVFFDRLVETTCYFQMEVLSLTGEVEVGYIQMDNLEKVQKGSEGMASNGVGLSSTGLVQSQGDTVYNYSWSLAYGDVIGIGITKETSKFSERRVWISKNGMLQNTPPEDEMDKWLATIEISAQEREEYDLGKKKQAEEEEQIDEQDEEKMKERAARERQQAMLKRQRISLKTFNPYKFYPAVICQGTKNNKPTVVNINVGGQIFRMNDATFRSGLLKNKSFFGDD